MNLDDIISTDKKPDFARIETEIGTHELITWIPQLRQKIKDRNFKSWYEYVNAVITYHELLQYLKKVN